MIYYENIKSSTIDFGSPSQCSKVAFADDVAVLAKDALTAQFNINIICSGYTFHIMERISRTVNVNKTKSTVISKTSVKHTIKLNSQEFEHVSSFKYLRSIILEDGIFDDK